MKYNRKYYGMSKIEQETYRYLCSLYSIEDIRFNEIIDERYPFHVDFYITSLDIFIEINAHYAHGGHIFGTVETDELVLEQLKQKIKENQKSSAKDNNLLYLPIWSNEIKVVIEEIEKFFKEHNLELPEPTYEYTEEELFPNLNKKEESK